MHEGSAPAALVTKSSCQGMPTASQLFLVKGKTPHALCNRTFTALTSPLLADSGCSADSMPADPLFSKARMPACVSQIA